MKGTISLLVCDNELQIFLQKYTHNENSKQKNF